MSTYTDTKNRIKETVNVTYHPGYPDDRVSTQKVKFLNEENEYWGTFKGKSVLEDAEISGSVIKDTIIKDVTLSGEVRLPGGVDINAVGQELENIKQDIEDIQLKDNKQDIDIEQLNEKADNISVDLTNKLTEVAADVTGLKTYVDERISAVNDKIDTDISVLNTQLTDKLSQTKTDLSNAIVAETTERIANDAIIKTKVNELEDNLDLSASELVAKIDRDKHYEIRTIDANSYPYQIKDFAINKLYVDIPQGKVIYNGKNIGSITRNADRSINFTVYTLTDPQLYEALIEGYTYTLGTETVPGKAGYLLKYDSVNNKINITSTVKKSLNIVDTNTEKAIYVGKVTTFSPDSDVEVQDVESGSLTIYPAGADSNYNTFYCQDLAFNKTDTSCIVIGNNQIIYTGNNKFVFRKNVYETKYSKIIKETIDPNNNIELGRIYKGNVVLGENDEVVSIKANINDFEYEISKQNLYGSVDTLFGEQLKDHGKLAVYNKQTNNIQIYDNIQYAYTLKAADDTCIFKPLTKNVHLYNYNEYDYISAEIHFGNIPDKHLDFVLSSEDKVVWTSNAQYSDLSISLSAIFDSVTNTLSTTITKVGDHGTEIVNSTYIFYTENNTPAKVEELYSYEIEATSEPIVFDYAYIVDAAEATFEATINPTVVVPTNVKTFQLAIEDSDVNVIDIQILAKDENLQSANKAREFILTTDLTPTDLNRYIEVKANYKITNGVEDSLLIHLDGLKHIYQFTEVNEDEFLYVDLTHHDLSVRVKNLEDNLAAETLKREEVDTEISTKLITLSSEVSTISSDTLDIINTLSSNVYSEINQLSDNLSNEIISLSTSLSGEINQLSDNLSNEIISLSTSLSNTVDSISSKLSTATSAEIFQISTQLYDEISTNTLNIQILSDDLNTVSANLNQNIDDLIALSSHYHNTLSGIDREAEAADDIKSDNLIITDPVVKLDDISHETYHDKYYMTFLSGTLVLKKIEK